MASRGKTTQADHMFTADFETCDERPATGPDDVPPQRVWLAGFKNLATMESTYFYDIDIFLKAILARGDNQNTEYAFHNLKFDGSFLVPALFRLGYQITQDRPEAGEFSVLIDERNAWYSMQIQVTGKRRVTVWDSVKLFPTALEYLHEQYGTPTQKIHEDESFYTQIRPAGHVPTADEMRYFENDLTVLAETLNAHIKLYSVRFKKTQASQSFHNFEQHFPTWKFRFPPLSLDLDSAIRRAYWGGISHAAPAHSEKDHFDIGVFDINSSYPYQLACQRMPYGECLAQYGQGQHPDMSKFWVAECLAEFTLKPNCVPCIPTKSVSEGKPVTLDHWLSDSEGVVRMALCVIDYFTIQQSYNFKIIRWCWSVHFAWKVQKEIASFINTNNKIKVECKLAAKTAPTRELELEYLTRSNRAKIDNNAFYGKFGEELIKLGKTPYPDEEQGVIYKVDRREVMTERKRRFLPLAIATTAWGRRQLVTMANTLGEQFLYCDTDSVHFLMSGYDRIMNAIKEGVMVVDEAQLGAWKNEGRMVFGRYLRPKCYMEETQKGVLEVTCAGLPADKHSGARSKHRSVCTKENFWIGLEIPAGKSGRLRTVKTPTGSKLVPTGFRIERSFSIMFG